MTSRKEQYLQNPPDTSAAIFGAVGALHDPSKHAIKADPTLSDSVKAKRGLAIEREGHVHRTMLRVGPWGYHPTGAPGID